MHAHLRPLFLSICTLIAAPTVLFAQQKIDFPSKGIAPSIAPAGPTADGVPAVAVFPDMPSKVVAIYRGPGFFNQELAARFEVTKDSQAPMTVPAKAVVLAPPASLPTRAAVVPAMPELPKSTTPQFVPPPAMPSLPTVSAGVVVAPSTPIPALLATAPQFVLPSATPPPQSSPPAHAPTADPFMVPATASRPIPVLPGAGSVPPPVDEAAGFVPPPAVEPSPLAPAAPAAVKSGRTTTPLVPINIPPHS